MRLTLSAATLALALLLGGCFPISLSPLHAEGDAPAYDPALLGAWRYESDGDADAWVIDPVETGDAYVFRNVEGDVNSQFRGVLVDLDGRRFLDLSPIGHEPEIMPSFGIHVVPGHSIWRVGVEENRLRFAVLDLAKTRDLLRERPDLIPHRLVRMSPGDADAQLVFTADTDAFRAFVRDHLTDAFFTEEIVLVPAEAPAETPAEGADPPAQAPPAQP